MPDHDRTGLQVISFGLFDDLLPSVSLSGGCWRVELPATPHPPLKDLFAAWGLQAPWTLCPSTTTPRWCALVAHLSHDDRTGGHRLEPLDSVYGPGARVVEGVHARETAEALVGAATGPPVAPQTLLLSRYADTGRLHYGTAPPRPSPARPAKPSRCPPRSRQTGGLVPTSQHLEGGGVVVLRGMGKSMNCGRRSGGAGAGGRGRLRAYTQV